MDQNIELHPPVQNPQHPPVQNPQHPPIQNPHHRDNIRKAATLTVAVLLVAITYQAILSPPGGFWPRNGYKNSTLLHSLPHSRAVKVPDAGKSILATKDSAMFTVFLTLNTLGFLFSVVAIYDLTEVPRKCELMTALLAIVASYLMCTIIITPKLMQYLPILTCLCVGAVVYCLRSCRKAWAQA